MSDENLPSRSLIVFTKPARPHRVKTRLIGDFSARQAADLHAAFTEDVVERLAGGSFRLRLAWALEGEEAVPEGLPGGRRVQGMRQRGVDLGERLYHALAEAARESAVVAAVGSDHPALRLETVHQGFAALEAGAAAVIGPARDGGYYLLGCRRESLHRRLFEGVPWSTSAVLEVTLDRCRELGLAVELLEEGEDVDTPQDLERLAGWLAAHPGECPRTRALLEDWQRLPREAAS